jgi:hypothetical protein
VKLTNQLYYLLLKRRMHAAGQPVSEILFYTAHNKLGPVVEFEVLEVASINDVRQCSLVKP